MFAVSQPETEPMQLRALAGGYLFGPNESLSRSVITLSRRDEMRKAFVLLASLIAVESSVASVAIADETEDMINNAVSAGPAALTAGLSRLEIHS